MTKREAADLAKRDALVLEHLSWAHGIASHVAGLLPTWFVADDLIGPVEIALCKLAAKYDAGQGVPFKRFAQARLYGACFDSVRRKEYTERAHYSIDALKQDVGSNPHEAPGRTWQRWLKAQEPTAPESGPAAIENPHDALAAAKKGIFGCVWNLPVRHQKVITLHYIQEISIEDIAKQMQVSASRISQIHREALAMLKGPAERLK